MLQLSRRNLLAGAAAAGAAMLVDSPLMAAGKVPFFKRIGRPIGIQLYALGEEAGRDLDKTFAEVAAIGYRDVELPNLYGKDARVIRAAADKAGLAISSVHLPIAPGGGSGLTLLSPADRIAEVLGTLGAKRGVAPIMQFPAGMKPNPGESFQAAIGRTVAAAGPDLWKKTAATLNAQGAALAPHGITVGYHNHNMEFAPLEGGKTGWEILAAETDAKLVQFELDIGWVVAAGHDPVVELGKLKGRVAQLHVKDVAAGTEPNFALTMKPTEVGSGVVDWAKVLPAAHKAGVQHFYFEQEPPFAIPRIEAARKSYGYLAALKA